MQGYWESVGYEWSFTWCGVGSRNDLPEEWEPLLVWVGQCMALLGGVLCTGDAPGSDTLFYTGYNLGRGEKLPPAQVYYTKLKNMRKLSHNPAEGSHEAERYPTHAEAMAMAHTARGSFVGLFPSGIGLHTRNAFQVLSEELDKPRWITVYWAIPVGKSGTKCRGGTNTAVRLSHMNNVPLVNLYVEDERNKFIDWLEKQLTKKGIAIPPFTLPSNDKVDNDTDQQ